MDKHKMSIWYTAFKIIVFIPYTVAEFPVIIVKYKNPKDYICNYFSSKFY